MTAMEMHPYYTEIPLQSFDAMSFEGHLSEVLLALIVDPHEAKDVARTIQEIHETWIYFVSDGKVVDAPIALADFQNLPSKHAFEQLKITLAQWVMTTKQADVALQTLSEWDQRFAVWCSCAVARTVLDLIPRGELRPLRVIETAEAWVRGKATISDVVVARASADAAYEAASAAYDAARVVNANSYRSARGRVSEDVTRQAAEAAYAACSATYADGRSVDAAARAVARTYSTTGELIRLREVVANACLTFPG